PILPLAPERFSMTICWPSLDDNSAASRRAGRSIDPPAANGTSMVMGREGQPWAAARDHVATTNVAASAQAVAQALVLLRIRRPATACSARPPPPDWRPR